MEVLLAVMKIVGDRQIRESGTFLRGYIAGKNRGNPIFHNHSSATTYYYHYPLVQYKVIDGNAYVVGLNEGAEAIKEISSDIEELNLGRSHYDVKETDLRMSHVEMGVTRKVKYKFLTPWLALSPENHRRFVSAKTWSEKKRIINDKIVTNIFFMAKRLGYYVIPHIDAHTHVDLVDVRFKGFKQHGFTGEFEVPFRIPDYVGLGKGASVGFGTIKEVIVHEENTDSHSGNKQRR